MMFYDQQHQTCAGLLCGIATGELAKAVEILNLLGSIVTRRATTRVTLKVMPRNSLNVLSTHTPFSQGVTCKLLERRFTFLPSPHKFQQLFFASEHGRAVELWVCRFTMISAVTCDLMWGRDSSFILAGSQ